MKFICSLFVYAFVDIDIQYNRYILNTQHISYYFWIYHAYVIPLLHHCYNKNVFRITIMSNFIKYVRVLTNISAK